MTLPEVNWWVVKESNLRGSEERRIYSPPRSASLATTQFDDPRFSHGTRQIGAPTLRLLNSGLDRGTVGPWLSGPARERYSGRARLGASGPSRRSCDRRPSPSLSPSRWGPAEPGAGPIQNWLRGTDSNRRPVGYEPTELPGCSTPTQRMRHEPSPAPLDQSGSSTSVGPGSLRFASTQCLPTAGISVNTYWRRVTESNRQPSGWPSVQRSFATLGATLRILSRRPRPRHRPSSTTKTSCCHSSHRPG